MTMKPMYAGRVLRSLFGAQGMCWDECHKIYILSDEASVLSMRGFGYEIVDPDFTQLVAWWDESCALRFISQIRNGGNTNDDIIQVISQLVSGEVDEVSAEELSDLIDEGRRLYDEATPGEWEARRCVPAHPEKPGIFVKEEVRGLPFDMITGWESEGVQAHVEEMVWSHNHLPQLLDLAEEVIRLRAEVEKLRTPVENLEIVNGRLIQRGAHPAEFPVEGYGELPYSDAEPLIDLRDVQGLRAFFRDELTSILSPEEIAEIITPKGTVSAPNPGKDS